ncbi:MAG: hypothetical protein ACAH95_04415 [Fimbriimonas sp.]
MPKDHLENPERRLLLVKWIVCAGLLAAIALTTRLWFGGRTFPEAPVFGWLPTVPSLVPSISFVLSLLAAAGLRLRWPIGMAVGFAALLVLLDLNRLQPWMYQYVLVLVGVWLGGRRGWALCACVLAFTYVWSGLLKLNLSFASDVFPWLVKPIFAAPTSLGFAAALFEVCVGVLLFVPRLRIFAIAGAALIHFALLWVLGPTGHNFNSAVWPWNICMPLLAFTLFFRSSEPLFPLAWSSAVGKVVLVLVGVMPALNLLDLWDDNLSASLYSGRTRDAWLRVEPHVIQEWQVPSSAVIQRGDFFIVDLPTWALSDLNVPPYPEPRVYRIIAQGHELFIRDRSVWTGATRRLSRLR